MNFDAGCLEYLALIIVMAFIFGMVILERLQR